ncbi:hypothetical protein RBH29_08105 [Herbivorax sp. ANBcel31]|uniref:hypothetical protein n=1 Tax=Herbivorax sp. ANBcel31 TaxID=3069754 RepID=UPI0027B77771|nr:hypothetical protein [Herbivorax sp. ANBcel31]MDQ2086391.1 hypothetical protein [Herbivorax sp. ANBcel31]
MKKRFSLIGHIITEDVNIYYDSPKKIKIELISISRINHIIITIVFLFIYSLVSETFFINAISLGRYLDITILTFIPVFSSFIIYKKFKNYFNKTTLIKIDNNSIILINKKLCNIKDVERLQIDTYMEVDSVEENELVIVLKDGSKKIINKKVHYDVLCKLADIIAEHIGCSVMKDICFRTELFGKKLN